MLLGRARRGERSRRLQTRPGEETLRKRGQVAVGHVQFDALDAMHGEEHHRRCEGLAILHHLGEIFERGQFRPAEAETLGREGEDQQCQSSGQVWTGSLLCMCSM